MEHRGPWKIKSSEVKYKNPWMEVKEDQVIRPDGKEGIFGTVAIKPGVTVLPLDNDGYVYLTEEFHYGHGGPSIEGAAGGIEPSEPPLLTGQRELKEELGIVAEEWVDMGTYHALTTFTNHKQKFYLARKLTFTKPEDNPSEIIKLVKIKFDEALEMVISGKIFDAYTSVLILKTAKLLGKL